MTTPQHITSRQNQRVKDAVRLRTSRERQREHRFLIDGAREITRAIANHIRVIEAFVCESLCNTPEATQALEVVRSTRAELLSVTPEVYEKLCFGERDEVGIVVVAATPERSLADVQLSATSLVAVLEGIEKPGNLGAILRTADGAGVDAVIVADGRTDLFNPNTIRASLGTVFRKNVVEATTADTIGWLRANDLRVIAARTDANLEYTAADLRGGIAIVLGSEADGLSEVWRGADVTPIRLPMRGIADSLNVSTTAAVLFYEALRQRGGQQFQP